MRLLGLLFLFKFSTNLFALENLTSHDQIEFFSRTMGEGIVLETKKDAYYILDDHIGFKYTPDKILYERVLHNGKIIQENHYTINSQGLRKTHFQKDHAKEEVLMVGGSFLFGVGVSDENTLTSILSKVDPLRNYYNWGRVGFGPSNIIGIFKYELANLKITKPIQIVYMRLRYHYERSWPTLTWHRSMPFSIDYDWDEKTNQLKELGPMFGPNKTRLAKIYDWLGERWLVQKFNLDYPNFLIAKMIKKECAFINEMNRLAKQMKAKFSVVDHPLFYLKDENYIKRYDEVFEGCLDSSIPLFSFKGLRVPDKESFNKFVVLPDIDTHPNAQFNQLLANEMMKTLFKNSAIKIEN
ncbi:MAG: hypothetical protein Fur0010_11440 [Bdellovibrio sp.]